MVKNFGQDLGLTNWHNDDPHPRQMSPPDSDPNAPHDWYHALVCEAGGAWREVFGERERRRKVTMHVEEIELGELVKVCELIAKYGLEAAKDRILGEWDKVYGSTLWQQSRIVCEMSEPCRVARIVGSLLDRAGAKCDKVDVYIRNQMMYSVSTECEMVSVNMSLNESPGVIMRLAKLEPGAGVLAARAAIAGA